MKNIIEGKLVYYSKIHISLTLFALACHQLSSSLAFLNHLAHHKWSVSVDYSWISLPGDIVINLWSDILNVSSFNMLLVGWVRILHPVDSWRLLLKGVEGFQHGLGSGPSYGWVIDHGLVLKVQLQLLPLTRRMEKLFIVEPLLILFYFVKKIFFIECVEKKYHMILNIFVIKLQQIMRNIF